MNKKILCQCLLMMNALSLSTRSDTSAQSDVGKSKFTIRQIDRQVVLYTIYRGNYDKIGPAAGRLFALAGQKQINPLGSAHYAYLNNPQHISNDHFLTEIRIPVDKEALKYAGTLGEMTDIKTLPAMEVAVVIKPKGLEDPSPLYDELALWIFKHGYIGTEGPVERFLTHWTTDGNYADMTTEIMLPVKKLSENKN